MDPKPMTDEENYCFDVGGYLIVHQVLTKGEIKACNAALDKIETADGMLNLPDPLTDPWVQLRDRPVLLTYLEQLTIGGFQPGSSPRLVGKAEADKEGWLTGGNEPRDPSRAYYHQNQVRFSGSVIAIWALTDVEAGDGGFVFVQGSHRSYVETPPNLLSGADNTGLVSQPALKAGDLLLCVETLLHGVRPWKNGSRRLMAFHYLCEQASSTGGMSDPPPDWIDELTSEQQAVIAPRGRPDALPVIMSDGKVCTVEERPGSFHPSIYTRDPNTDIDEKEFYLWDLCGHLVLKGVMDEDWLAAANNAIDQFADRIEAGGDASKGSKVLAGTSVPSLKDLFNLPRPYCEPFREMIAHPAVVQRLNWMMGSGFTLRSARAICSGKGTSGHGLHSGAEPLKYRNSYVFQNGRTYCKAVNVAWQLRDVMEADGGFVCVPGSHKARYPLPHSIVTCEETMGLVRHVEMQAGDVVIFLAAAQTHGAYPWRSDISRRAVLLGYGSRNTV